MSNITRRAAALLLALGALCGAQAQEFPSRPITLVVPYAAGGPTDVATRIIAEQMRAALGVMVAVENKPGASTIVGAQYVANAKPDGYTLLMVTTTTLATNPHLYKKLAYKIEDFEPIAMTAKVPIGLAVKSSLPVKTIREFRDYVKARPGKMSYGSAGTGANSQLVNALMNQKLELLMAEIPYKGTAPALNDLVAGHVDAVVDAIATLAPRQNAGQLRILGNFDDRRSPVAPDVPTFLESGYPDLVAFTWNAVVGPAGMPKPIVEKLSSAIVRAMESAETQRKFAELGFIVQTSTPAELAVYMRRELDRWGPLIRQMGIQLD